MTMLDTDTVSVDASDASSSERFNSSRQIYHLSRRNRKSLERVGVPTPQHREERREERRRTVTIDMVIMSDVVDDDGNRYLPGLPIASVMVVSTTINF